VYSQNLALDSIIGLKVSDLEDRYFGNSVNLLEIAKK
jgi:hypothetical protein